jgi:hypothetical protein
VRAPVVCGRGMHALSKQNHDHEALLQMLKFKCIISYKHEYERNESLFLSVLSLRDLWNFNDILFKVARFLKLLPSLMLKLKRGNKNRLATYMLLPGNTNKHAINCRNAHMRVLNSKSSLIYASDG